LRHSAPDLDLALFDFASWIGRLKMISIMEINPGRNFSDQQLASATCIRRVTL